MLIAATQSRPGRMPKITERRSYANKSLGKEFASNTSLRRRVAKWTAECHQNAFLPLRFMCRGRKKRRLQFTIWMSGTGNVRRAIHWLFSGIVSVILIVQLSFERWTLEKHSIFGE
jgi:hypothetical protein